MAKGKETRQLIIQKAATIFNTKGIAATSMSDIMEVTGLSKGSLYVHFESKDDLAEDAADYSLDILIQKITAAIKKEKKAKGESWSDLARLLVGRTTLFKRKEEGGHRYV